MILVDTSAWVEFLRDTGSPACERVDALLDDDIAITDAIRMELLAGARDEDHLRRLRGLTARTTVLATTSADYELAALLYLRCRHSGETVRKLIDCLIAAVAIRHDVAVLHHDRDFDVLARHTELRVEAPEGGSGPDVGDEGPGIAGGLADGGLTDRSSTSAQRNLERGAEVVEHREVRHVERRQLCAELQRGRGHEVVRDPDPGVAASEPAPELTGPTGDQLGDRLWAHHVQQRPHLTAFR